MGENVSSKNEYEQSDVPSDNQWDMTPPDDYLSTVRKEIAEEMDDQMQEELMPFEGGETEVINGVTVEHTGMTIFGEDGEEEVINMYDANGNRFYSNFEDKESAEKAKERLAAEGVTAVIGPEAPWRSSTGGVMAPRGESTSVGLYIVPEADNTGSGEDANASAPNESEAEQAADSTDEDAGATVSPEDFDF